MKTKILAFGASTSSTSINQAFVTWAASQLSDFEVQVISLRDFDMPLFSVDREKEYGYPENVVSLHNLIKESDGIMISLAEHNGAYTAAFKSVFDWLSRLDGKAWNNKSMLLLSTSPGGRGGASVMEMAIKRFPFNGGEVVATFSLPKFKENFDLENGILNNELLASFKEALNNFEAHMLKKSPV